MKKIVCVILCLFSISVFAKDANKIVGYWLTQDGDSQVKIFKATNGKYYGKIVWLDEPYEEDGTAKVDDENPDEKLQRRHIMNLMLLNRFKYDEKNGNWSGGTIYDPKTGNTYKCNIWFEDDDTILPVKGYIGISLIGRKVEWTREKELRKQEE